MVAELDAEIDSWPESSLFKLHQDCVKDQDTITTCHGDDISSNDANYVNARNRIISNAATIIAIPIAINRDFPSIIQSVITSEDKLFFIAHTTFNGSRKEWKLVQLDLQASIKLSSTCIQDGKFIMNFLIQHPHDVALPHQYKRFWTEYHRVLGSKKLHSNFELIKPSEITSKIAKANSLIPY